MLKFALLLSTVFAVSAQLPQDLEDAARYQLYAAYGAYCHSSQLEKWDCKWCKKIGLEKVYGVSTKVSHDGQAFVIRNNESQIIVSFRGSHNIPNWISDFTFDKVELKWAGVPSGIKVHLGFLKGYEAMQDDVKTWVAEAAKDCPKCTVHVTGHSLGAAEAVLCVTDLRLQGYKPEMWNFGLPRVGDEKFAEWFDNTTKANDQTVYRMVERHDVVPHLPMHELGFHHIAVEVWHHNKSSEGNAYIVCDGSGEDKKCSRSVPMALTNPIAHLVCNKLTPHERPPFCAHYFTSNKYPGQKIPKHRNTWESTSPAREKPFYSPLCSTLDTGLFTIAVFINYFTPPGASRSRVPPPQKKKTQCNKECLPQLPCNPPRVFPSVFPFQSMQNRYTRRSTVFF